MNDSVLNNTNETPNTQSPASTPEVASSASVEEVAPNSSQGIAASNGQQAVSAPEVASAGLTDNPIAKASRTTDAIHNAFVMGRSLQELKSKVLLGAIGLPEPITHSDPAPETESTAASSITATPPSLAGMMDTLLQTLLVSTSQSQVLTSDSNGSLTSTSEWRAIFIRIATIQNQCFPDSSTQDTPYDPSPNSLPKSRFPFLYPATSIDYASIGISSSNSLGGSIFNDEHLTNFKLYDITRRALNCLSLLYTKPEESLLPDLFSDFQTQIVESFHIRAQNSSTVSEEGIAGGVAEILPIFQAYLNGSSAGPAPNTINDAIKSLSFLLVRFLDSWDGFLRENFFSGGILPNNELELLAYESGYALSSLSSAISLKTASLGNNSKQDNVTEQLLSDLTSSWQNVFTSSFINTIQRQISALGPALDDAYYNIKNVQRPAASARPNPDLPGNVIHAITYSLDYWQRAVDWICTQHSSGTKESTTTAVAIEKKATSTTVSTPPTNTTIRTTTTAAAIEAATTSTTVSSSPSNETVTPPPLTVELSRQLCQALATQVEVWQSLMLGQQTLRSFAAESVTKRILNNFMSDFENAAKQVVDQPVQNAVNRFRTPIIVMGIIALVIVGGGIVLLTLTGQLQSLAAVIALFVGSALTLVSSTLARVSTPFSSVSTEQPSSTNTQANNANLEERLNSLFGLAGEAISTAFQNAYTQVLIEFDYLNHNVAISYPLIDIFTSSPDLNRDITDGYYFLTKIVWTSEEQKADLEQVTRAAFGPLGALIGQPTSSASSSLLNDTKALV